MSDSIRCPITKQIFKFPCIAEDGKCYERYEIKKWLENNNTSPITRQRIGTNLYDNVNLKEIIEKMLEEKTELKDEQYKPLTYCPIDDLLTDKLYTYDAIKFTDILGVSTRTLIKLMKNDKAMNFILENSEDLYGKTYLGWPIEKIILHSSMDITKKAIDMYHSRKITNLHFLFFATRHKKFKIVEYFLSSKLYDINDSLKDDNLIHYICKKGNDELIKYVINYDGVNINKLDQSGKLPIHYIAEYSTIEMVRYFLSKGSKKDNLSKYLIPHLDSDILLDFISSQKKNKEQCDIDLPIAKKVKK